MAKTGASGLPLTGVEAAVVGIDKYFRDLAKMNATTAEGGETFGRFGQAATSAAGGLGSLVSAIGGPAGLVVGIGAAVLAVTGLKKVLEGIIDVVSRVVSQFFEFAILAGRFQELEYSAIAVGRAMGQTTAAVRAAIADLREAGIRTDVAAKSVALFTREQVDLARSAELARIAQAGAILTNRDSSEVMEDLALAIATGNSMRLRTIQISVSLAEAEERFAASLGKTREQLTQSEVAQARVNAIIEDGAALMGVYDASMESPTKRLRSFQGRILPEFGAAMGAFFLPALGTGVDALTNLVKGLTEAVQEGGVLYPVLVNLGAAFQIVAEAASAVVSYVIDNLPTIVSVVSGVISSIMTPLSNFVSAMHEFGVAIVEMLAEGIIAGMDLLIHAMNAIGGLLEQWLGPGSPPKVAPELDKWGIEAMEEYLRGFAEADFGVLEKVQGPLRKVLTGPDFRELSAGLIATIGEKGIGEEFFQQIAGAAGEFGDEIAELARREHALAQAVGDVEEAERNLQAAQENAKKAQGQVRALTTEYNQLLRAGADESVLEAKMAELRAAEEGAVLAREQVKEAETAHSLAQAQLGPLKEQLAAQESLVNQLMLFIVQEKEAAGATSQLGQALAGISGPGGAADQFADSFSPKKLNLGGKMTDAIGEAVERIKEKIGEFVQPFVDAFLKVQAKARELADAFDRFKVRVATAWQRLWDEIGPIIEDLDGWFVYHLIPDVLAFALANSGVLFLALQKVWEYVRDTVIPTITGEDGLLTKLAELRDEIKKRLLKGLADLFLKFEDLRRSIYRIAEYAAGLLGIIKNIIKAWEEAVEAAQNYTGSSPSPLALGIRSASSELQGLIDKLPRLSMAFPQPLAPTAPAAQMTTPIVGGVGASPTIIFQTTIANGMDQAAFEARVKRVVVNAIS